MSIPRSETPPRTDQEWADALKEYGRDRDDLAHAKPLLSRGTALPKPSLFDTSIAVHPSSSDSFEPSNRPLYHAHSFESSRDPALHINTHSSQPASSLSSRGPRRARQRSISSSTGRSELGLNLGLPVNEKRPRRESFGSEDSILVAEEALSPALGIAYTVGAPRNLLSGAPEMTEEEKMSSDAERLKLRAFYEKEGWLPGPRPGRVTKLRRIRAVRRLGLCHTQEQDDERHAVIAKYAELAKQIFNTRDGSVSILREEEEAVMGADPKAPTVNYPLDEAPCSHAVLHPDVRCTVIADMTKDWRFRNNPTVKRADVKFYASAPLRYRKNDLAIDFGALCIYDGMPRNTFDAREQSILLNLANMLVYQLTTLQSEIMAKRSSAMYEQSISFLRRSVTAGESSKHVAEVQKQKKKEKEAREENKQGDTGERKKDPGEYRSWTSGEKIRKGKARPRRPARGDSNKSTATTSSASESQLAIKSGPRNNKDAKLAAIQADQSLFTDAAQTLREILKADAVAIVNVDEYQLFIRRSSAGEPEHPRGKSPMGETKESIIGAFLQGKPWPADVEPVIHYVPHTSEAGVQVLGTDVNDKSNTFHFNTKGAEGTLGEFIRSYLQTRHFWWDREDAEDDLSIRIMDLMPKAAQTILAAVFITPEGKTRFAIFVSWNRPPSEFGDSSTIALPFAWILGGCTMAALAIRKVRQLEQSQISYSNLQAHELRTPLHQILAITQLLRSSMNDLADLPQQESAQGSLTTTQQIRDLLPFLDAIDTSGKTLHGIVDNILSFLDLRGKDSMLSPNSPSLLTSPSGVTQSIEVMFEELIHEAHEEDKRSRRANGQPVCPVETVFEIIPPLLGEQVTEDAGGALRRAISKILSNAYKFIDGQQGCVEIYVDDVPSLLPPEGCEDSKLALTKRISIKIVDNGKGMDPAFINEKLGEPWAKEDPYATGSGLSVHLAYRIIDLMGGQMEVASGPGQGCTVTLEVPVPRRHVTHISNPEFTGGLKMAFDDPAHLEAHPDDIDVCRKVALEGFDDKDGNVYGLQRLKDALAHQYVKLGCEIVPSDEADLVVAEGRLEEIEEGLELFKNTSAKDIVFLVGPVHEAHRDVLKQETKLEKTVRRFRKPATPSILRESLFPGQSKAILAEIPSKNGGVSRSSISSPEEVDPHGHTTSSSSASREGSSSHSHRPKPHKPDEALNKSRSPAESPEVANDATVHSFSFVNRLTAMWNPRNMDVEDAVANLSLGDYFSSRRRSSLERISSTPRMPSHERDSTTGEATPNLGDETDPTELHGTPGVDSYESHEHYEDEDTQSESEPEPDPIKVLVVEDNMVNRRILVKIVSTLSPVEVFEAADGQAAVELFKDFTEPIIVLLDINMPKMDGYQASLAMRAIEKQRGVTRPSQIIAVTALGGEAEKHRGLVECGMNQWHTKPCSKAKLHEIVQEAREFLRGVQEAAEANTRGHHGE